MTDIKDTSLNKEYAIGLLLHLLEYDAVPISTLRPDVSKNYQAIRNLVDQMTKEGLVEVIKQQTPYRRFDVHLTDKGIRIATKLREIELEMKS